MLICNVCRESNNHCHFFFYDFSDCNGSKKYCGDVKYQYSMQSCRSLLPRTPMQSAHVKIFGGNLKKCIQKIHSNFIKKIIILIQSIDIYIWWQTLVYKSIYESRCRFSVFTVELRFLYIIIIGVYIIIDNK